jgi:hypothetical protein
MEEKAPSKLFRTLQILIPLASVVVAITGVLLTVAARKKELTCTLVNSTRLVNENLGGISPDLHVEFHGQPIFSLTKMTFEFRNTGAAAILAKDVVEPVKLAFPVGTKLMSSSVEKTFPPDLSFSARAFPDGAAVYLEFPLLNRGDEALFSVYVLNSELQRASLEGRIVDVPQLIYSEANAGAVRQSTWPFQSHATRSVVRWMLVTIYSTLTLLFLGLWIGCIRSYVSYLPWKRKWKNQYDKVVTDLKEAANKDASRAAPRERRVESESSVLLPPPDGWTDPDDIHRYLTTREHVFVPSNKMNEELKKRGIEVHPGSFIDSIGALSSFSALLLSLAAVSSTTALIIYRSLST